MSLSRWDQQIGQFVIPVSVNKRFFETREIKEHKWNYYLLCSLKTLMLSVWDGLKITNYKGVCKAKYHKSLKTAFLGTTPSVPMMNSHSNWQTIFYRVILWRLKNFGVGDEWIDVHSSPALTRQRKCGQLILNLLPFIILKVTCCGLGYFYV